MLRRSQMRRRTPVGRAARRRLRAGGPRATGRPAATVAEWAPIRELVLARAHWACQACGSRTRLDVHHVLKRAQGGSDFDLDRLAALCRRCHEQTDVAYSRGRLVVTPLGDARFAFALVRGAGKGAGEVLGQWESLRPAHVGSSPPPSGVLPTWAKGTADGARPGQVTFCPCGQSGLGSTPRQ